jgi:glycosyltransferase involved in cell wall biosynthesis
MPCDISFVLRCCDDEERVGHMILRIASHLREKETRFELLLVDEGSGDNTLAIAALLRATHPELEILHAAPGQGYRVGAERARGRVVVVSDLLNEAPMAMLGFALGRLEQGTDVVALDGRFIVFRRTRALRALDALESSHRREQPDRRFVRRAKALGLGVALLHPRRQKVLSWVRNLLPMHRFRAFSLLG